jgi:hypothetical protein
MLGAHRTGICNRVRALQRRQRSLCAKRLLRRPPRDEPVGRPPLSRHPTRSRPCPAPPPPASRCARAPPGVRDADRTRRRSRPHAPPSERTSQSGARWQRFPPTTTMHRSRSCSSVSSDQFACAAECSIRYRAGRLRHHAGAPAVHARASASRSRGSRASALTSRRAIASVFGSSSGHAACARARRGRCVRPSTGRSPRPAGPSRVPPGRNSARRAGRRCSGVRPRYLQRSGAGVKRNRLTVQRRSPRTERRSLSRVKHNAAARRLAVRTAQRLKSGGGEPLRCSATRASTCRRNTSASSSRPRSA